MSNETQAELGTFIAVYVLGDGSNWHVVDAHWDEIDAALHQYVERGINKVLMLTATNGAELMLPVSRIGEVLRSTPESRETQRKLDSAAKSETGFDE